MTSASVRTRERTANGTRVEDRRFVTGAGQYVGDLRLPGMASVAFLRSAVPHAHLRSVDVSQALTQDGVVAALTGEDYARRACPIVADSTDPGWQRSVWWPLARDRVRFVGEAVAAVVGEDRYAAEDGVDRVRVDYEPLSAVVNVEHALGGDAPILHPGWRDNVYARSSVDTGAVEEALAAAPRRLTLSTAVGRSSGIPMETRGCVASHDSRDGTLTLWTSTQWPHLLQKTLPGLLDFPPDRFRVIGPDVGGAFGVKAHVYPEEIVVCLLALQLERPVKWIEDRREHFLAAAQSRDQQHELEVGYDDDGRLLALRARIHVDCGGYSFFPFIVSLESHIAMELLPGPYDVRHYRAEALAVATNKTPIAPYRGIARVPACFSIERAMDQIARDLDLDPVEVRRRNLVRRDQFPYTSATGLVYDSGSFLESLDELVEYADLAALRAWRGGERTHGRHIGIGIAVFVQETALGLEELNAAGLAYAFTDDLVRVSLDATGMFTVAGGHFSHGQGLETTLAQLAAEKLDVPPERVRVVQGDTDRVPSGSGTWGSRSAVVFGAAVELATADMRQRLIELAAGVFALKPGDVVIAGGHAEAPDGRRVGFAELAAAWAAEHAEPLVVTAASPRDHRATYANGAHLAVVDVDVETGAIDLLRYVVVNDSGRMINPIVVEGQIHGAVCQGIGGALYEEFAYDMDGQPLSTSFLEYVVPTAREIPDIEVRMLQTPAPNVIGGRKGAGEAGAVPPQAVIASAVEDAIAHLGPVFVNQTPLTPPQVHALVERARRAPGD
jgi:carbon-monoxide dehydrogenase large subunit